MAEATRIRSFVAINLAEPVRAAIGLLQHELAGARADVRWVPMEGMHGTLRFLGTVETPRLEAVHAAMENALRAQPGLRVRAHGVGTFPSLRRPHVLWVGLQAAGLVELAMLVDTAVTALGFEPERRPFMPHATVGRVNSVRGWAPLETLVKAHHDDDFGCSDIDAVTIYRSTLRPTGAVYAPLWSIALHKPAHGRGA